MEELQALCSAEFSQFMVLGYTKQVVAGTMYQIKIKVAEEGDTPVVHMKMMQHLPHTGKEPEIVAFKQNQTVDAPFDFTDTDIVMRASPAEEEMKNEGEQAATDADAQMAAQLQAEDAN